MKVINNVSEADLILHAGIFHADDITVATIMDELLNGQAKVARVEQWPLKDPVTLKPNAIVADIGLGEFDHHQPDNESRKNGVPYAAAGKIWKKFGHPVIRKYLYADPTEAEKCNNCPEEESTENSRIVKAAWGTVDATLIQGIDSIDNGAYPAVDYPCTAMSISSLISSLNLTWDSTSTKEEAFESAVRFMGEVLRIVITKAISTAKSRSMVDKAIKESENHRGYMILEKYWPWQSAIFNPTPELKDLADDMLYAIYPSARTEGVWNWQVVPVKPNSFDQRCKCPPEWCGKNGADLVLATGVSDAIFCHKAGFLGSASSKEAAITLVKKAIAYGFATVD